MQDDDLFHCSAGGGKLNLTVRNYKDALPFSIKGMVGLIAGGVAI
jgi:hypothetical protein